MAQKGRRLSRHGQAHKRSRRRHDGRARPAAAAGVRGRCGDVPGPRDARVLASRAPPYNFGLLLRKHASRRVVRVHRRHHRREAQRGPAASWDGRAREYFQAVRRTRRRRNPQQQRRAEHLWRLCQRIRAERVEARQRAVDGDLEAARQQRRALVQLRRRLPRRLARDAETVQERVADALGPRLLVCRLTFVEHRRVFVEGVDADHNRRGRVDDVVGADLCDESKRRRVARTRGVAAGADLCARVGAGGDEPKRHPRRAGVVGQAPAAVDEDVDALTAHKRSKRRRGGRRSRGFALLRNAAAWLFRVAGPAVRAVLLRGAALDRDGQPRDGHAGLVVHHHEVLAALDAAARVDDCIERAVAERPFVSDDVELERERHGAWQRKRGAEPDRKVTVLDVRPLRLPFEPRRRRRRRDGEALRVGGPFLGVGDFERVHGDGDERRPTRVAPRRGPRRRLRRRGVIVVRFVLPRGDRRLWVGCFLFWAPPRALLGLVVRRTP
mmetsp:Transcript_32126/g.110510  ORF Transcript_32126/g.110510 Transcript_32126/m.110510 type:complete len:497 (+) Transcript_32126:875-2365(+)